MATEPPWGGEPPPPPPPAAARQPKALPPSRPEVTRADLEQLVESKFDVRSRRGDQWECRCPAHEDMRASCGAKFVPTDEGGWTVVVKCMAGCPTPDVLAAVGLTFKDLYTYDPRAKKKSQGRGRIVAEYTYTDEKGVPLFAVVRFEPKDFRQHALNPDGSTPEGPWSLKGVRRVLYRLPRVREAVEQGKTLFVVEGEKDVENLERLGVYATCNMGGAASGPNDRKWLPEYADMIAGAAHVVVIGDNDEPGRAHAATIAKSLKGKVDELVVVDLARFWPECPEKGDVSDFLAAHPGPVGLARIAGFAVEAAKPAEIVKAEPVAPARVEPKAEPEPVEEGMALRAAADWRWDGKSWDELQDKLIVRETKGGAIKVPCVYNASLLLDCHGTFRNRIHYDEFSNRILFQPPDWWLPPLGERPWTDTDTTQFQAWGDKNGIHFSRETVKTSVMAVGQHHVTHPLREWLDGLVWDGKERLPDWLDFFVGANPGRYSSAVGVAWMISTVARVYKPGCQADHVLVLRGAQGIRKTTLFRVLGGEFYASMQGVRIEDKDAKQKLLGKWIVEFAELEALHRADVSSIKAYVTETSDHFRKPYGEDFAEFKRQCVFAGTINQGQFLKDETGNRRFWIVECHVPEIDVARFEAVRPQLLAEAVARFKRGEPWWLSKEDEALARAVQESEMEPGTFDYTIADWLTSTSRAPGSMLAEAVLIDGVPHVAVETVVRYALGREVGKWNKADAMAVTSAMGRAGWRPKQVRLPGAGRSSNPRRLWAAPEAEQGVPVGPGGDDGLPY